MKINPNYFPVVLFGTLALGIVLGATLNFPQQGNSSASENHRNKLNKLIDFIDNEYVDQVNTDSIVDLAASNILDKLDPHSVYVPKIEQAQLAETMKGDFVGIGVNFYMLNDTIAVVNPVVGGPSEKAGIKSGDRILYANKEKLFGRKLTSEDLYSRLKGEKGTDVSLVVYRKSENKKLQIQLKREVVAIESVAAAVMINPTLGYIKINRFAETTHDEFKKGLIKLKKQGAKSLIIDVRDNGGGYMEIAAEIADELLKDKQLIVFTKNKKGKIDKTYATEEGEFETGKVYILINESSASASEILAGAIQDNDRGTVIGRRSFGKGLVQREMNFQDGSAVRLTIARYYTPTGRSIQKPYKKGGDDYNSDFDKRLIGGELYKKDSIKVDSKLKYKTPKGKIVYGGGGIVPDVFVPLEVEHGDEGVVYLMQSGAVGYFVFEELDKSRKQFQGLKLAQAVSKIDNADIYYENFKKYLSKNGLDLKLEKDKKLVKRYLTAEFTRQLFGENSYYSLIVKEDPMIKKVQTLK
jgi:carboxyl-terminal processing protease